MKDCFFYNELYKQQDNIDSATEPPETIAFAKDVLNYFEKTFCVPRIPFVAGGFCEEWYLTEKELADTILQALQECCEELNGAFVETHDLLSNNQVLNNGDDIHFCRESLHILGKRYFDAYMNIVAMSM